MPSKTSHSSSFRDSASTEVGSGGGSSSAAQGGGGGPRREKDALSEDRRKSREFLGHCLEIGLTYTHSVDLVQECVKHSRERKAYTATPPVGDPALGAYAELCEKMREFVTGRVQDGSVGKWSDAFVRKHAILVDTIVYCFRFTFLSAVELAMQRGDFRHNELSRQHSQGLTKERWAEAKKSSAIVIRSFYHSCMRHQLLKIKLAMPVEVQEGMLRKASNQWIAIATHRGKPLLLACVALLSVPAHALCVCARIAQMLPALSTSQPPAFYILLLCCDSYRSSRLSMEAYIWKMNLSKELVVSKIGSTHCDLLFVFFGLSRLCVCVVVGGGALHFYILSCRTVDSGLDPSLATVTCWSRCYLLCFP